MAKANLPEKSRASKPLPTDDARSPLIVVDCEYDAMALELAIPKTARVVHAEALATADDERIQKWADCIPVLIVLPGEPGPEMIDRARAALARVQAIAESVQAVAWDAWEAGEPFGPPNGLDSPGSLLAWLLELPKYKLERPRIAITTEEHDVNDQAVAALAKDRDVYQRAFHLVIVRRDKAPGRGIDRPPDTPRLAPLPSASLRERLARLAEWVKLRKDRNGDEIASPAHPPDWCPAAVAARGEWDGIRHLDAVVETPILRPDGSILDKPGYDNITGILYVPNCEFPPIPPRPTRDDAGRAVAELLAIVQDFPFKAEAHRMAWLAGCLTPYARFGFEGPAPLFAFDANAPGVGKSMLADVVATLATGRRMARTTYPDSDDEMRKQILSIALSGDRLMLIDNIPSGMALGGGAIDGALTGTTYKGRILGRSEMSAEMPLYAVWYATGNNLALKGDALRRVIPCRLETTEERPEERDGFAVSGDLLAHVRANRGRLVACALTILRAYHVAGRPDARLKPFGSFEQWALSVRRAIHWCTGIDPCETRKELVANDPETISRAALVDGWAELPHAERGVTVADALRIIRESPDLYPTLHDALMEWSRNNDLPSVRTIASHLKAIRGRVCNGRSLQSIQVKARYQAWKVVELHRAKGESGESGESDSNPSRGKSADNCTTSFGANGEKQTHQTHQTHPTEVLTDDDPWAGFIPPRPS